MNDVPDGDFYHYTGGDPVAFVVTVVAVGLAAFALAVWLYMRTFA